MKKSSSKILWGVVLLILVALTWAVWSFYGTFFLSNIDLGEKKSVVVFIPTGSDFEDVCQILTEKGGLKSTEGFRYTAKRKGYIDNVKPGRYRIKNHMSNNALVNMLRSGNQEPVMLVFNNVRTIDEMAIKVANHVEFKADSLLRLLQNDSIAASYGFTPDEFGVMFIPDSYEVFWNISPEKFLERMKSEFDKFWNDDRLEKAAQMNLTPAEVSILASIVISETVKRDEMPTIAGVYYNRLQRGMKLEADPTVKFALGNFELKRILFRHLEVDSPYNTYKYAGLPPGPIYLPDRTAIDAVLNYEKHDYIFMCAKADFSGYHAFAKTNAEHERNARQYQHALNEKKIR